MTRSYSFLPCPDGPEPSITDPGQWWGGEDRRNKSWCPVQLNRLTLWSADDIYDSVNTVYVVLIDFSPCHRSIYMLGFCTIIQKKWLFYQLLYISWSFKAYMNQISKFKQFSDLFFSTHFLKLKKNEMCVHMMNIFLKMIIRKKCFLMLKYRESRTYYILFYMKSKYFFSF